MLGRRARGVGPDDRGQPEKRLRFATALADRLPEGSMGGWCSFRRWPSGAARSTRSPIGPRRPGSSGMTRALARRFRPGDGQCRGARHHQDRMPEAVIARRGDRLLQGDPAWPLRRTGRGLGRDRVPARPGFRYVTGQCLNVDGGQVMKSARASGAEGREMKRHCSRVRFRYFATQPDDRMGSKSGRDRPDRDMLVSVVWGVFTRLVGISAPWTEKVMLIMLPTLAFRVAPIAYRRSANVALDLLRDALPPGGATSTASRCTSRSW